MKTKLPANGTVIAHLARLGRSRRVVHDFDEGVVHDIKKGYLGRMAEMPRIADLKKRLGLQTANPKIERQKKERLKKLCEKEKVPWRLVEPILDWYMDESKKEQPLILKREEAKKKKRGA